MSNMRLIDANKLFYEKVGRIKPRNKEHYKAIGEFMNMITNSETIEIDDWIPISEPPKENGDYIVSLEDSVYPWGRFFNGKWFMLSTDGMAREFGEYEVIAWMPLPKPYREREE